MSTTQLVTCDSCGDTTRSGVGLEHGQHFERGWSHINVTAGPGFRGPNHRDLPKHNGHYDLCKKCTDALAGLLFTFTGKNNAD